MSYHSEVLADTPVAWYKLGEGSSSTAFDFIDGHDGAYVGNPLRNQPGLVPGDTNTAVKFTGSNYMRVPHDTWMDTSTWSIEMLVKLDSLTSDFAQTAIVARHGSAGGIWDLLLNNGKVQFRLVQAGFPTAESTTTLAVGQKYHLVGTYDGTQIKLYVNGVLEATTAATSGNVGSVQAMTVAKFADGYDFGYLSGTVDEVACYGTALPAARIAVHSAAAGLGSAPPANVAPTASFTWSVTGTTLHLDASGSTDGDGTIVSYEWDLGDDQPTGKVIDWVFPDWFTGLDLVQLKVTDNLGAVGYASDYADFGNGGGGGGGGGDVPGGDDITLTGTSGTFAIDFAATNPVTIHYTPAFDGSLTIQATSPVDWEPLWAVYDSDGDEIQDDTGDLGLVWVSTEPLRLMVEPNDGFSAQLTEFTWSYAARASSALTISLEYDYVEETPAGLMVDIANGNPGETITFSMTGPTDIDDFQTATLDAFGNYSDLLVNLPAVNAGTYFLYVEGSQSGGEDVQITIEDDALSWDDHAAVVDTPPAVAAINRWRFFDLRDQSVTWTFEKNPESWTNVFPPTDFTHGKTTAVDGQPLTWQAASRPWRMEFTGTITTQAEYEALTFWSELHRRFWLIDHRNRAWLMTIEQFDAQAQVKPGYPWLHKYSVRTLIFMQGTTD